MTTHPPPLPEVERFNAVASAPRNAHRAVEVVLASTFDAHVSALKEQLATARGLDHVESEAHKITAQKCAELRSAVRLLREQVRHAYECEYITTKDEHYSPLMPCTCGASQALADTEKWV